MDGQIRGVSGNLVSNLEVGKTVGAPKHKNCTSISLGAGGSVVASGTMLQAGRSRFRFPMKPLEVFFN
jgi:hypothetical protein